MNLLIFAKGHSWMSILGHLVLTLKSEDWQRQFFGVFRVRLVAALLGPHILTRPYAPYTVTPS